MSDRTKTLLEDAKSLTSYFEELSRSETSVTSVTDCRSENKRFHAECASSDFELVKELLHYH